MRLLVPLLLLFVCVAGCTGEAPPRFWEPTDGCEERPSAGWGSSPDWSLEEIQFTIVAAEPFQVQLPVVASADGASVEDWQPDLGSLDAWEHVTTSRGSAIEVQADEGRTVRGCTLQEARGGNGCCAEAYLDGTWSLGPENTRPTGIWVHVVAGTVAIEIEYLAESNWCGAEASFDGSNLAPGWHLLEGEHAAYCT